MTLELFTQPFIASDHYFAFKEFDQTRSLKKSVFGRDKAPSRRPRIRTSIVGRCAATPSTGGNIVQGRRSSWCGPSRASKTRPSASATSISRAIVRSFFPRIRTTFSLSRSTTGSRDSTTGAQRRRGRTSGKAAAEYFFLNGASPHSSARIIRHNAVDGRSALLGEVRLAGQAAYDRSSRRTRGTSRLSPAADARAC
jgi:hypothetical protein